MRSWMVGLVVVGAVVFAIGVGVILLVTSSGSTALVDLEPGDCFDLANGDGDDGTLESVDVVDCAAPHLAEVVLVGDLNSGGEPYPSDDELFVEIDARCRDAGVVDDEAFGLLPVAPTQELWDSFDGRFLCVAVPFGGEPVAGSLVGNAVGD